MLAVALLWLSASGCTGLINGLRPRWVELGTVTSLRPESFEWGTWATPGDLSQDCTGNETSPSDCVHLGDRFFYKLPTSLATSCSGLVATDTLGLFDWTCAVSSGQVTFSSVGLKNGKTLRDLIDFDGGKFLSNRVEVSGLSDIQGPLTYHSPLTAWHRNPVQVLSANQGNAPVVLSAAAAGTVFVIRSSMSTGGFELEGSSYSVVAPSGTTLTWRGNYAGPFFDFIDGAFLWLDLPTLDSRAATTKATTGLRAEGQKFLTLESITAQGMSQYGVFLRAIKNSTLGRRTLNDPSQSSLRVYHNGDSGFWLEHDRAVASINSETRRNRISSIWAGNHTNAGIHLEGNYLTVDNLQAWNSGTFGVESYLTNHSSFGRIKVTNSTYSGFYPQGFNDNKIKSVELAATTNPSWLNFGYGFYRNVVQEYWLSVNADAIGFAYAGGGLFGGGSGQNVFNNVTLINSKNNAYWHQSAGLDMNTTYDNVLSGVLVANVSAILSAHNVGGPGVNTISNLVGYNADTGLDYMASYPTHITGMFLLGGIATHNCSATSSTAYPDCTASGTDDSTDFPQTAGYSDGFLRLDGALNNSTTFASATGTTRLSENITNWFPGTLFNYWVQDHASPFSLAAHGRCEAGSTCALVDVRLLASANKILNKSGRGIESNSIAPVSPGRNSFNAGNACPTEVNGDQYATSHRFYKNSGSYAAWWHSGDIYEALGDGAGNEDGVCDNGEDCQLVFLRNAREIIADGIGDDDGLCESGEACIYSPNVGAYQGHGPLRACTFTNTADPRAIRNVQMYGHEYNGY